MGKGTIGSVRYVQYIHNGYMALLPVLASDNTNIWATIPPAVPGGLAPIWGHAAVAAMTEWGYYPPDTVQMASDHHNTLAHEKHRHTDRGTKWQDLIVRCVRNGYMVASL